MDIGLVGLGAMGGPISRHLLEAGNTVTGYDVSAAALSRFSSHGGKAAGSPREVSDQAETVLCSLPTAAIVAQVVQGESGLIGGRAMRTFVELSTVGRPAARTAAATLAAAGVGYVDAPVSGGVTGAELGTLAVMVSGDENLVDTVEPLLQTFSSSVIRVGPAPGQAQVVKLANNLLSATAIVVSAEAVLLAVKSGVDPRVALDVIGRGTGRNSAVNDKFPRLVVPRRFESGFKLGLLAKDLRLCMGAAEDTTTPMLAGRVIESLVALAEGQFGSDADSLDYVRMVEQWAHAQIDDISWTAA
ncbi:NAD(P)-dependent oxidoreductase [Micromonospora cremea]|uniref:2-hydroxy-3-oxopropionate reductase n=1 Tax=Micromonospora cremea TaxID=709881 RepID=A0A1N5VHR4_9ACTN|nr:NAD(P)-dependent oxidoreductase [Micromonospora cremea]SIM72543.1 2-hydroxy-3-oxopropionate reductase [Micromonospora cremea]